MLAANRTAFVVILFVVSGCASDPPTEHPYEIKSKYGVADPAFQQTIGNLLGAPFVPGNSTTTLQNGDEIFPAMLDAIATAKETITFETYVYWKGEVGASFAAAFAERASQGVKVHVILDKFGADRIDPEYLKLMRKAGVEVVEYHPLRWYDIGWANKLNNRTHRKLLIIDGTLGFTGGVGIADEWMGKAETSKQYRDTHYRVRGPVVSQLQSAFVDNWMEATGIVLHGDEYFPKVANTGEQWAQVFKSSPRGGSESMELMYLLSMTAAARNIRLVTPYFVPDTLTIKTLISARRRGVSVQIIVPGATIDEKIVRSASRARWGELLKAGVEISEYGPAMLHSKLMIVDDAWVSIGSANLDNRSFRLNDEANLNVLDPLFAAEQIRIFDQDLAHSQYITFENWENRPPHSKAVESFVTFFGWLM